MSRTPTPGTLVVRAVRLAVVLLAVLFALGGLDGYWGSTLAVLAVVVGLPVDSVVARSAAGLVAVAVVGGVIGDLPHRNVYFLAEDATTAHNLPFFRAFVSGALLGEALYAVVVRLRRRSA